MFFQLLDGVDQMDRPLFSLFFSFFFFMLMNTAFAQGIFSFRLFEAGRALTWLLVLPD